jgi:hypothetical protein
MIRQLLKTSFYKIKVYIKTHIIQPLDVHIIQPRYLKIINEKRNILLANKKIRVAFFVTQKQLWCAQSVYDNFLANDNFKPTIVVFPNGEDKINNAIITTQDNYSFFKKKNMNVMYGFDIKNQSFLSVDAINADVIFYDQPHPWLPKKLLFFETSKKSLLCYIPYGYKVANAYEAHFNMPLQNSCWNVFVESSWHQQQFKKYAIMQGRNTIVSGYPKLDAYNNKKNTANQKINNLKRIIWAPHWTIDDLGISYSTFKDNYKFFLKYAAENPDIYWIFKPHQRLRYYLEETGFMSKKEVDLYYSSWESLANTSFYNESDYFDLFQASDALITDCGSFLAEYLPTQKPILLLVNKRSGGYNEMGEKLIKSYYRSDKNDDIKSFIENVVINKNDYLKEKRLENLYLVQPNKNGAGKFIVDYIQKELKVVA